ncbi:hypothetical protein F4W08_04240 [Pantoea dispersa]|nr:hypothetical protein F4W08_04240 [Pantoea dispersa]
MSAIKFYPLSVLNSKKAVAHRYRLKLCLHLAEGNLNDFGHFPFISAAASTETHHNLVWFHCDGNHAGFI